MFTDLAVAAPGINKAFTNLPAFANSSTAFFTSLGRTAQTSGPAIASTQPLLGKVQTLGSSVKPFAGNLSELLTSLRNTGGLERFLDFVFLGGGSLNGYDSLGHFLRAEIIAKNCVGYKVTPQQGCSANFVKGEGSAASASAAGRRQLDQPRDGPHARGPERRDPGRGDREIPGLGPVARVGQQRARGAELRSRGHVDRHAGRWRQRGHDLLLALDRKLERERDAAQLPARQLIDP